MNIFTQFFRILASLFGNGRSTLRYDRDEYFSRHDHNDGLRSYNNLRSQNSAQQHSNSYYRHDTDDHYGDDGEFERYEHGYEDYDDYFEDDY